MRRAVPVAIVLSLAMFGAHFAGAQQWIDYRPSGAGYRVEFPAKPTEDSRDLATSAGKVQTKTSAAEIGDRVFLTVYSVYPSNAPINDPQSSLDRARDGSVRNVNGTLRSEQRLIVNNAPARRVLIDIPQSNQAADSLMVLDGHGFYQAVYIGPRGTEGTPDAKRFLSSFALLRQ
jgi:hypothetical protein